jgi:hypothetical protein
LNNPLFTSKENFKSTSLNVVLISGSTCTMLPTIESRPHHSMLLRDCLTENFSPFPVFHNSNRWRKLNFLNLIYLTSTNEFAAISASLIGKDQPTGKHIFSYRINTVAVEPATMGILEENGPHSQVSFNRHSPELSLLASHTLPKFRLRISWRDQIKCRPTFCFYICHSGFALKESFITPEIIPFIAD